ncbi:MAG: DUF4065 domain-containing protein [Myxococcales bacterium]|nr:DUF4065 domain-containing protein [Myxococcales bacterium]HQY65262.1 hypothetical protein [Polyangiaceae bacterium]
MDLKPEQLLGATVRALYPYGTLPGFALTPLKLHKLCFYAAGVAWAHGEGGELRGVTFEAWKHGPVLRAIYSGTLPDVCAEDALSPETRAHARDAVQVYGLLSAWGLREQSHLEAPWIEAHSRDVPGAPPVRIPNDGIEAHFRAKFAEGVTFPEHLTDRGIFTLDGLHFDPRFQSFAELAAYLREALAADAAPVSAVL